MNNSNPLVSIVTSTFNSEKTIRCAMESVLNQTYPYIEYIIADGMSTDSTLSIVEEYKDKFESKGYIFRWVSGKDSGIYGGMNKGIRIATGEIVGIVNSDDFYEPNAVENVVTAYKDSNFDLIYGNISIVDANGKTVGIKKSKKMKHLLSTRYWNHPSTFVSQRLYKERLYDESFKYYADWDFILWVHRNYKNIVVIDKLISNFRLGGATTRTDLSTANLKCKERFRAYVNNEYSKLYMFECIFMDYGKEVIMRIMGK